MQAEQIDYKEYRELLREQAVALLEQQRLAQMLTFVALLQLRENAALVDLVERLVDEVQRRSSPS